MTTPVERLDELLRQQPSRTRRLSLFDRCAAFAALKRGWPQKVVARAFAITPSTVSLMANAERDGWKRYDDIKSEYARLGHEDFCHRYLTDEIETRIRRFVAGVETEEDLSAHRWGPDAASDRFAWRPFTLETQDAILTAVIDFRQYNEDIGRDDAYLPQGWAWRYLEEREIDGHRLIGRRANTPVDHQWSAGRQRTSGICLDAAFESHGLDKPMIEVKTRIAAQQKMSQPS